ncbi:hypothetical protein XENTR_v10004242, partial [Xenopus tropicalis]
MEEKGRKACVGQTERDEEKKEKEKAERNRRPEAGAGWHIYGARIHSGDPCSVRCYTPTNAQTPGSPQHFHSTNISCRNGTPDSSPLFSMRLSEAGLPNTQHGSCVGATERVMYTLLQSLITHPVDAFQSGLVLYLHISKAERFRELCVMCKKNKKKNSIKQVFKSFVALKEEKYVYKSFVALEEEKY